MELSSICTVTLFVPPHGLSFLIFIGCTNGSSNTILTTCECSLHGVPALYWALLDVAEHCLPTAVGNNGLTHCEGPFMKFFLFFGIISTKIICHCRNLGRCGRNSGTSCDYVNPVFPNRFLLEFSRFLRILKESGNVINILNTYSEHSLKLL